MSLEGTPSLPALTLTATLERGVPSVASISMRFRLDATLSNQPRIQLPAVTLAATGRSGGLGIATLALPGVRLAATGRAGNVLTSGLRLPAVTLAARFGNTSALTIPFRLAATARTGGVGRLEQRLPAFNLAAAGLNPQRATGAPTLPAPRLAAALTIGGSGQAAFRQPVLRLVALGVGGSTGAAQIRLLAPRVTATAYTQGELVASFRLPFTLLADNVALAPNAAVSGVAFAMTTRTGALTTYEGFGFNSFARFAGKNLAAGASGIYELAGTTDASAPIASRVRGTVNEAGVTQVKRLLSAFCGYRATGGLEFRMRGDGAKQQDVYTMPPEETGLYRNRVKFGRGAMASYWEWEVRNLGGARFELDVIEFETQVLPRKRA